MDDNDEYEFNRSHQLSWLRQHGKPGPDGYEYTFRFPLEAK